jgi:hypothetical protein
MTSHAMISLQEAADRLAIGQLDRNAAVCGLTIGPVPGHVRPGRGGVTQGAPT